MSKFFLRKMKHEGQPDLQYFLGEIPVSDALGNRLLISFTGKIECVACGRGIKKTFNQGYCYPCFQSLAACDMCIVRPNLCHYHKGTCREPEWGEENCMRDHVVYLANTTGLKVGITKAHQTRTRWGDQGALEALLLAKVPDRLTAGLIEHEISQHISDKSNWRALLKGDLKEVDLLKERERIVKLVPNEFQQYIVQEEEQLSHQQFRYPIESYLEKAKTHNLDKTPEVSGNLKGIRGQYLLLGEAGLNIRKYAGYEVEVEVI